MHGHHNDAREVRMDSELTDIGLSRRKLLVAGAGTAVGASLLAACGGDDDGGTTATADSSAGAGDGGGGGALAKVADIPVGGAVAATGSDGKPVIVAQPTDGEVVAFSAICTHQGCTVAPADKILKCPCHGSTYDLATGTNTGGPAPKPLTEIAVKVEGGEVLEA
jgi:nitrite reductase/ring-hydroxylating ferredoxin subunit